MREWLHEIVIPDIDQTDLSVGEFANKIVTALSELKDDKDEILIAIRDSFKTIVERSNRLPSELMWAAVHFQCDFLYEWANGTVEIEVECQSAVKVVGRCRIMKENQKPLPSLL